VGKNRGNEQKSTILKFHGHHNGDVGSERSLHII